ncbi:hypothetical protein B0T24DRAFT_683548 [Lasiosphaeria ovina]|uniref:Uncharacterized protein n=1 Tax=Lasiosphaeria ovina TaxID=92902 RepID=A0AAE0JWA8_9PEZI|nr:hypothetical protein B0T24DRAFT_683548 [Lasiosphaeria ovina]
MAEESSPVAIVAIDVVPQQGDSCRLVYNLCPRRNCPPLRFQDSEEHAESHSRLFHETTDPEKRDRYHGKPLDFLEAARKDLPNQCLRLTSEPPTSTEEGNTQFRSRWSVVRRSIARCEEAVEAHMITSMSALSYRLRTKQLEALVSFHTFLGHTIFNLFLHAQVSPEVVERSGILKSLWTSRFDSPSRLFECHAPRDKNCKEPFRKHVSATIALYELVIEHMSQYKSTIHGFIASVYQSAMRAIPADRKWLISATSGAHRMAALASPDSAEALCDLALDSGDFNLSYFFRLLLKSMNVAGGKPSYLAEQMFDGLCKRANFQDHYHLGPNDAYPESLEAL